MGKDKHKLKKKSSKKYKRQQSSADSSSSEEEWVEQPPVNVPAKDHPASADKKTHTKVNSEQDDWLSNPALFACVSREEIRQSKEKNNEKKDDERYMLDRLGQTSRELNPYWKDGGTGLPTESAVSADSLRQASVTVGDQGAAWLRKALQRAREQAALERRPLEDVVAERWGSLEKLENMIEEAERRDLRSSKNDNKNRHNRRSDEGLPSDKNNKEGGKSHTSDRDRRYNKSPSRNKRFAKPKESGSESSSDSDRRHRKKADHREREERRYNKNETYSRSKSMKKAFAKPRGISDESSDDSRRNYKKYKSSSSKGNIEKRFTKPRTSSSEEDKNDHRNDRNGKSLRKDKSQNRHSRDVSSSSDSSSSSRNSTEHKKHRKQCKKSFKKPSHDSEDEHSLSKYNTSVKSDLQTYSSSGKGWRKSGLKESKSEEIRKSNIQNPGKVMTVGSDHSSPVKEIPAPEEEKVLTDKEMNELAAKLVKAELLGNQDLVEELKTKLDRARQIKASHPAESKIKEEVVILTHTDSKGFTRPVSFGGPLEPSGGRRKAKKVETHSGGKRMRYFADDDKYSLQEMFQREKLSTVEDSNEVFAKLASKGVGRDDSARDMEDVFEETARMEEAEGKTKARARQQAVEEGRRTARSLDTCQWCLDSHHMLKHLIVAIGKTCYLCVPPYQSLTDNHCLIVPSHHAPCGTQLDEDVWAEMMDFRKRIVKMFLAQEEDVVFFESARYLNRFPHMVLNCVPMPKETGDLAPIYFKKAIQECEMEWSNNKKLVDLKGRDVRKAVPRGLPYFAVDFGMDSGFAHVIEDEKLFPQNFAEEIIGGMMDLDHTIWRKQRKQTFEEQSKKVIQLSKMWGPFDKKE